MMDVAGRSVIMKKGKKGKKREKKKKKKSVSIVLHSCVSSHIQTHICLFTERKEAPGSEPIIPNEYRMSQVEGEAKSGTSFQGSRPRSQCSPHWSNFFDSCNICSIFHVVIVCNVAEICCTLFRSLILSNPVSDVFATSGWLEENLQLSCHQDGTQQADRPHESVQAGVQSGHHWFKWIAERVPNAWHEEDDDEPPVAEECQYPSLGHILEIQSACLTQVPDHDSNEEGGKMTIGGEVHGFEVSDLLLIASELLHQ